MIEGGIETYSVSNNEPKARKTPAPGNMGASGTPYSLLHVFNPFFLKKKDGLFENEPNLLSDSRMPKDAASLELTQAGIILNERSEILKVKPEDQKISIDDISFKS